MNLYNIYIKYEQDGTDGTETETRTMMMNLLYKINFKFLIFYLLIEALFQPLIVLPQLLLSPATEKASIFNHC